nr:MAG TPA: hypothetical protein [Caudoviricetes sp.]
MFKTLAVSLFFTEEGIGRISTNIDDLGIFTQKPKEEICKIVEGHTEYSYRPSIIPAYRILKLLESLVDDDVLVMPIDVNESYYASSPGGVYKYMLLSE